MPSDLRFDTAPFSCLTPWQRAQLTDVSTPVGFAAGAAILTPETDPQHLYLLTRGRVELREAGQAPVQYGPRNLLALRALLAGRCNGTMTALDEVRAVQLPKATVLELLAANPAFADALFAATTGLVKTPPGPQHKDRQFLSLMMARVADAYVRKAHFVDGSLDLVSVCRVLSGQGLTHTLVRDTLDGVQRIGMFTTTDLRDALLDARPPDRLAVSAVARFELVSVTSETRLYDALLLMIRHRVHRLLVQDGEQIVGVLSQLDLMGFVSNHSHLIAVQVEQAGTIEQLQTAALQMNPLIEVLHSGGVRIEVIAGLVSELNRQIFARLWSLLAPPGLLANSCLIVMGSEGRGEQILKTDQDNALLLRDGYECPELEQISARFNQALLGFGYPSCPGNIMLTNPLWRQSLSGFKETLRQWLKGEALEASLHLAIFMDAKAVAGDADLLNQARSFMQGIAATSDAYQARFVSAIDQFSEPGWWARLGAMRDRDELAFDIKKLGTFPIVHGVRALALQNRLGELGTTERIRLLVKKNQLSTEMARDLIDVLHFLMALKLGNNLRQSHLQLPIDNLVRMSELGSLEREQLKDSLAIIKRFKLQLRQHFRLDVL